MAEVIVEKNWEIELLENVEGRVAFIKWWRKHGHAL